MNILGYISAILIMIGIAFQGYYFNWLTDRKLQDNLKAYHSAYRDLGKEYVNNKYALIPEKKINHPYNQKNLKEPKEPRIHYKKELTPYCMRLNLWPYRNLDINKTASFTILEKLITILYKDILISEKNIHSFTKKLILAIQTKKTATIHLEQLKFKDLEDQEIYFQMLKGKESYYPSFLNYVVINEDSNPNICLACADFVMLKSLFNEKVAETLTQKKQSPLERLMIDKNTFHTILLSYGKMNENLPKISLKHKKSNLKEIIITSKEETTQIQLNQKIRLKAKVAS